MSNNLLELILFQILLELIFSKIFLSINLSDLSEECLFRYSISPKKNYSIFTSISVFLE